MSHSDNTTLGRDYVTVLLLLLISRLLTVATRVQRSDSNIIYTACDYIIHWLIGKYGRC